MVFSELKVLIREFRVGDYDALINLWNESKLPYRPKGRDSRKAIKVQIRKPYTISLVVELDRKIIGSIWGTHDGRRGWINRLAVHPAYQRKGIAKKLVKEVEKQLHKTGIWIICSLIEDWNKTSMEVFKHLGYKKHKDIIYFSKRKSSEI